MTSLPRLVESSALVETAGMARSFFLYTWPMVDVYGPHDESTSPAASSPTFSEIYFLAAFTRRCSFMRIILLRTILRQ